jgi:hypothetical protein
MEGLSRIAHEIVQVVASAVGETCRFVAHQIVGILRQRAVSEDGRLVGLFRFGSYDETPLHIRSGEQASAPSEATPSTNRAQVAKLFQSTGILAALYQLPDGSLCSLEVPVPASLSVMDHGTAECIAACLKRMWGSFDSAVPDFEFVFNIDVHDRASANLKYEDFIVLFG